MCWRLGIAVLFAVSSGGCGRLGFDASSAADASGEPAPLTFCETLSPPPDVCDDYEGAALSDPWQLVLQAPGRVQIEPTAGAPSGLQALTTEMTPTSGTCFYNMAAVDLVGDYTHIRVEVDVFMPAGQTLRPDMVFGMTRFNRPAGDCEALVFREAFAEQTIDALDNRTYATAAYPGLTNGTWQRLGWEHQLLPEGDHLRLTIDGVTIVDRPASNQCLFRSGNVSLALGFFCVDNPGTDYTISYDNAVFYAD